MPCPYAKRRGVVVFCEVLGKNVNPLVMPCLSDRYERCPHYQRKKREEARAAERRPEAPPTPAPAREAREEAPAPQPVERPPPPPTLATTTETAVATAAATPSAAAGEAEEEEATVVEVRQPKPQPPAEAVAEEEAPPAAPPAPSGWSDSESERLADPVTISQIILRAPLTARLRVEAEKLDDMLGKIANTIKEWREKCFIIDMRSSKGQAYVKVCKGEPVAAATIGMPLKREELEELVEGTLELRVYGPLTE